jgi:hypothetical protein
MKNVLIYQTLLLLLLIACKEEEVSPSNEVQKNSNVTDKVTDYYPLGVGNYWVYESFQVDTLGNEISFLGIDSVVVTSDTLIDGQMHFYIGSVKYPDSTVKAYSRYRDSSGCIVNQYGRVFLSVNNFTDTLHTQLMLSGNDTIEYTNYKMQKYKGQIEVPAGVFFDLLNFKGEAYSSLFVWNNGRNYNNYFQKGIGKALSVSSPKTSTV